MILTNEQIDELADATVEDFEDALLAHARKSNAELVRQNLEIERLRGALEQMSNRLYVIAELPPTTKTTNQSAVLSVAVDLWALAQPVELTNG
jgi:hypothetical protein|tara:strand:+ start:120 stop:398 length:279 start_codon:yes stop_codon:yes gene_type:complete